MCKSIMQFVIERLNPKYRDEFIDMLKQVYKDIMKSDSKLKFFHIKLSNYRVTITAGWKEPIHEKVRTFSSPGIFKELYGDYSCEDLPDISGTFSNQGLYLEV